MKKRCLSILLILTMILSMFQGVMVGVAAETAPTIAAEEVWASSGATVEMNLNITNNPGILGATVTVAWGDGLTLVKDANGTAFAGATYQKPSRYNNAGTNFMWYGSELEEVLDGTILTLTFDVGEDVQESAELPVVVTCSGVYDENQNAVSVMTVDGCVKIVNYLPGDVSGSDTIDPLDLIMLARYISDGCSTDPDGYNVELNESAADVNDDGRMDALDLIMISRYISDGCVTDPEGYNIVLKPSSPKCVHEMEETPAKEANCTETGNIPYWQCVKCEKYFSDANGNKEITFEDTVLAIQHVPVIDPAVAPTYETTGLTEGSHCALCKTVLVKQDIVPVLTYDYSIKYNIFGGDTYLATFDIENPNPSGYNSEEGTDNFASLEGPTGYTFAGWYDAAQGSADARRVTIIEAGSKGNREVYAHWDKTVYKVTYASDMVPITDDEYKVYTTDKGISELPTPQLDKYTFVGWSDSDGNIWSKIPAGTATDITLYANWSSNRNKAVAVNSLKDPIILEDSDEGLILFTYEIGTIKNVPLFTTLKLNCVNGIITENSRTEEKSISSEQAKTIAQTISNATTNSSSWTLSKDWNNTTEVSQTYLDQTEQKREEAETLAKSQSNTYNLSTSLGGSNTNTKTSAGAFKLSGNQSHSDTTTTETGQNFDLSVDAKYSSEKSAGLSLGIPIEGLELGIEAGKKSTFEIGGGVDYGNYVKNTNTGTDSWSNGVEMSSEKSKSNTSEKSWNTSAGYSSSSETSMSSTVSTAVSKLISQEYGYGKSYSEGGSNSEAQELASTDSKSDEFSTTMTYYSSEIVSTTTSYSSTGNTIGDYRLVMAGEVHVFAVVGYDVAQKTYFVYTYNVLDDKTEEYLDYSYDGTFNDYETSIIPFEVPSFVNDYVNNRVAMTEGLRIDPDTGIVDKYTPSEDGAATIISVPSYVSVDNGDGTFSSVKVTGISSDLFKNNTEVVGVILGHHITEIPDNAFEGCTALKYVIAPGVTKIGNGAFSGCSSLEPFAVPYVEREWKCNACAECISSEGQPTLCNYCSQTTSGFTLLADNTLSVGENAFLGVPTITAVASNDKVAKNVAASGAQNIVLDISKIPSEEVEGLTLTVGEITRFELQGKDKEYKNLSLKSDATTTIVNGVKIVDAKKIPMELSSENVTLNRVNIASSGYAMLLTAENTAVTLNGNNNLSATSGNTVVCRNVSFVPMSVSVVGKINVTGNLLVCGTVEGEENITCDDIIYIDEATYDKYKKGMFSINFDANGGVVNTTDMTVFYGTTVGELPTPTRDNCTFLGWYKEDGTQITADSSFLDLTDITVKAHWQSGWILASEMPNDGAVSSSKWTYDLTSKKEHTSSTLAGWTLYDTKRTSWGATVGPVYSNPNNGSRNVWSEQYVSSTTTHYKFYHRYGWGYNTSTGTNGYVWGSDSQLGSGARHEIDLTWDLAQTSNFAGNACWKGYSCPHCGAANLWLGRSTYVENHYSTRWYYQEPVYTYYFTKTEAKESTTEITPSDAISNVQKWVQYVVE